MQIPLNILKTPRVFDVRQRVVGGHDSKRRFLDEHVRAAPGDRVLDIGCGTGALRTLMPSQLTYLGVEIDPSYVALARSRLGPGDEIVCADIGSYRPSPERKFDLAIAYGVFHHLDDERAHHAVEIAAGALAEGGRFVISEPCWVPGQGIFERLLMRLDRGRFVRTIDEYLALVRPQFPRVHADVARDTYRVPYTMVVVEASA